MRTVHDDAGFTLLEVLVAFAVASLGVVTVYTALGFHWRNVAQFSLQGEALALVQSHLDTIGVSDQPVPGRASGSYPNGLRWQMTVVPMQGADSVTDSAVTPAAIVIEARDRRGKVLAHLKSYKLLAVRNDKSEP
jgi:prepilin-type N-terminal cleavage/methylation domain-containing protein